MVTENKIQFIDLICPELENECRKGLLQKLIVTGNEPVPVEISREGKRRRYELLTYHEEATVIMVQQQASSVTK